MSSAEILGPAPASHDALGDYLRSIGAFPLLEAEEEVELARAIEVGLIALERLREQPESPDAGLLRQLAHEGEQARCRFIRSNLRLVVSVAKHYSGHELPLMDLIQEGNIGLDRAVKKYDYAKGFKFSTYATWWIRQAISRSLAEARLVRVPARVADSVIAMRRQARELEVTLGRRPTTAELAQASSLSEDRVRQLLDLDRQPISLHLPLGDDGGTELGDLIEDDRAADVVDIVGGMLRHRALHECLAELPGRDARVLAMRFGLDGDPPCTLDELSVVFGISRERVRQIERRALSALRARRYRARLTD